MKKLIFSALIITAFIVTAFTINTPDRFAKLSDLANYLTLGGANQTITQSPIFENTIQSTNSIGLNGGVGDSYYQVGLNPIFGFVQIISDGSTGNESSKIIFNLNKPTAKALVYSPGFYSDNRLHFGSDGLAYLSDLLAARNASNFGQTGSMADVGHFQNPWTGDNTYRVGAWLNLLTVTGGDAVIIQVTYTDENSVAKTKTFYPQGYATGSTLNTAEDYPMPTMDFRALSGSTIQVTTTVTGTGTILYNAGCTIEKIN